MILIVGATGVLGQKVVRLLLAEGHRVRAMTRALQHAQSLEAQGAEIVIGDLIDAESVAHACKGVDRVLAAAHSFLGKGKKGSDAVDGRGHRALIDAARAAGVARFVYTSSLGAAPDHPIDFFQTKYQIERYLEISGMDYVILRPSAFMEWHAHTFNGANILRNGNSTLIGSGRKPRNFVAAGDVAWFAIHALKSPTAQRRIIPIGGPGNYSNEEVARLYGRIAGIEPKIRHVPRAVAATLALAIRPFHPGVARVMRLSSLPDDAFSEYFDADETVREYGVKLTTLEEFVREQVQRWRAKDQTASAQEMA